jgi:YbbR domain-containing protein
VDKWLDQLTDNKTFMKLVALVMAFLLFGSIYDENMGTNDVNVPGDADVAIIAGIPVKSYYDTENLVVTGVPETVEVTLEGPTPNVQATKTQKDFEVFVDLTKAKVGKQRATLQVRDLSNGLTASVNPSFIEVNVQEKVTKDYTIDIEYDKKMIAAGYEVGSPVMEPSKVTISGGKDVMEQIIYVKATVGLPKDTKQTVNSTAAINVLDKELNKLNVMLERESVKVTIPIEKLSKTVPIEIVEKGSPPEGIVIDSISLDKKEAIISGNKETLNKVENVRVEVDLSKISENAELTLPVIISDGLTEVDPKQAVATIKVSKAEAASKPEIETDSVSDAEETTTAEEKGIKSLSNIPIQLEGVVDNHKVSIKQPSNGRTSLKVMGTSTELTKISEADFQVVANVTDLSLGDHEVKVSVDGPKEVSWELADQSINISITEEDVS